MTTLSALSKVIKKYDLLKHDYYQAWTQGKLTRENLQFYAAQYYHQVKSFPTFISRVHANCPDILVRKVLLSNLIDEELHGTDHPSLWLQFTQGLGLSTQQVLLTPALAETQAMVDQYNALASDDWRAGLCALYAYECQIPEISASKIAGLEKYYQISDEKSLEFFQAHQVYDVKHAEQVAQLIEEHVPEALACKATEQAAAALWGFLDGVMRAQAISC